MQNHSLSSIFLCYYADPSVPVYWAASTLIDDDYSDAHDEMWTASSNREVLED